MQHGAQFAKLTAAQCCIAVAFLFALNHIDRTTVGFTSSLIIEFVIANVLITWMHLKIQDLRESSRKLALIAAMNVQVNQDILLNEDLDQIYGTILNYLFDIFQDATTGSVLILGEDGYLRFSASKGFTEDFVSRFKLRLEDTFLHQITHGDIKTTRLITQEAFKSVETVLDPETWKYQSVISAPLFIGDRLFGLLNLDSSVAKTYNEKDVEIVERFRAQVEVVLLARERYSRNIKRYQTDALTGFLTRHYFQDQFKNTLDRAIRHQEKLVIAMFDVDGLKRINDTHGHIAGDHLITLISEKLRNSGRTTDIFGRVGGDEFVACYLLTDIQAIERNIEVIRQSLDVQQLPLGPDIHAIARFSYGLASYPEDGADLDALMAAADARMYQMKVANRPLAAAAE